MSDKEKSRVTVIIMGEEYILRGSSTSDDMHKVGRYLDRLMRTLSEKNIQMSKYKIAVLAALNLADELLKLKEEKTLHSGNQRERGGEDELV